MRRTTVIAICDATTIRPTRWLEAPPAWPRAPSARPSRGSRFAARTAVISPSAIATSADRLIAKASTGRFIDTSSRRGRSAGASDSSAVVPSVAISRPPRQLIASNTSVSARNCRTSRPRPAPSA